MESLGTSDPALVSLVTRQLGEITQKAGGLDPVPLNQALALVQGIGPKDEVELMLATQMAAVHQATMVQARRLHGADNLDQQNSSSNALNKLARTFTGQVETLKRYRTGGVQKVIVQHVQVNEGGQAVVAGEVTTGGGGYNKEGLPHERNDMRVPECDAVHSAIEALGVPMQGAGRERLEGVPVSWRPRRAAVGAAEQPVPTWALHPRGPVRAQVCARPPTRKPRDVSLG